MQHPFISFHFGGLLHFQARHGSGRWLFAGHQPKDRALRAVQKTTYLTPLFLFLFDPRSSIESKDQANLSQILSQALISASHLSSHSYILKPLCFLCHVLRQRTSAICKRAIFLAHEEPRKIISLDTCSQSYAHLALASPRSMRSKTGTWTPKTMQSHMHRTDEVLCTYKIRYIKQTHEKVW